MPCIVENHFCRAAIRIYHFFEPRYFGFDIVQRGIAYEMHVCIGQTQRFFAILGKNVAVVQRIRHRCLTLITLVGNDNGKGFVVVGTGLRNVDIDIATQRGYLDFFTHILLRIDHDFGRSQGLIQLQIDLPVFGKTPIAFRNFYFDGNYLAHIIVVHNKRIDERLRIATRHQGKCGLLLSVGKKFSIGYFNLHLDIFGRTVLCVLQQQLQVERTFFCQNALSDTRYRIIDHLQHRRHEFACIHT